MPPPGASPAEQEAFLKSSHEVVTEYFRQHEVPLPSGSLACYDPASGTLSLRTMNVVHEMVDALSAAYVAGVVKHLSWRLEIVEAASADVRVATQQCQGRSEHRQQLDHLTSKGEIITTMHGEARGGQQSKARQGSGFNSPVHYVTNASGQVQPESEWTHTGVLLELDPVIREASDLIDLDLLFQYCPTAPKPRLAQLTAGSAPKIEVEWLDLPTFTTKVSTTFRSGETRLLGVWNLEPLGDPAKAGQSQAAFLCAHIVKLIPAPEPRLEAMLRESGEAVLPTPKAGSTVIDPALPPGMMIRRFRVPPDFEYMPGGAQPSPTTDPFATATVNPADPFAAPFAAASNPAARRSTAKKILEGQGIPFPPGAFAKFMHGTNELVVCNLPENLDLADLFLAGGCWLPARMAQTTIEIIEADATLLRRLARECESLADHSAVQKALEAEITAGKARVFRSAWIETRGGQQAIWENIVLTKTIAELDVGVLVPPGTEDKTGTEAVPRKHRASELSVVSEEEKVGFQVELDPMITEGGLVDVNLLVTVDTASIGTLPAAVPPEPGIRRLAAVNTARRYSETKTSLTFSKGIPRLIALYQPSTAEGPATNVLHAILVRSDIIIAGHQDK